MYRRKAKGWYKHIDFIILDIICLELSFLIAYVIRHGAVNPYHFQLYRSAAIVLGFIDFVLLFVCNTCKNVLKRGMLQELYATVKHDVYVILAFTLYLFAVQNAQPFSRIVLFLCAAFYMPISYVTRLIMKEAVNKMHRSGDKPALLIVSTSDAIYETLKTMGDTYYQLYTVRGIVILDKDMIGKQIKGIPVVASESTVIEYVCRGWVDELFMACPHNYKTRRELVAQFVDMGIVVHENLFENKELLLNRQMVEHMGGYTVLTTTLNYASGRDLFLKRLIDICGGIVGCIITGILFVILAPLIYIQSPGPIFFSQERVGKNGKRFKIYKFRSMYLDAEERKQELMEQNRVEDGMMFKLEFDPRIIGCKKRADGTIKKGVGNYIRDWSLDEFPQFFNVLKGDMSIVGTRPPTMDEWGKYEIHHRARLATKPGITGMWQVSGRSDITDFEEVVALDTKYINDWSIGLDIKILFKTVLVVLHREGAM